MRLHSPPQAVFAEMGVGVQELRGKGAGLRFGREILDAEDSAFGQVAVYGPEMFFPRLAGLAACFVTVRNMKWTNAHSILIPVMIAHRMDLESVKGTDFFHPPRGCRVSLFNRIWSVVGLVVLLCLGFSSSWGAGRAGRTSRPLMANTGRRSCGGWRGQGIERTARPAKTADHEENPVRRRCKPE